MAEYIDREALMKNFCGYDLTKCVKYGNKDADQYETSYSTMMMYEIADVIYDFPDADVAPVRHGKWRTIGMRPVGTKKTHYCYLCGNHGSPDMKFCPNCGAKMDLG